MPDILPFKPSIPDYRMGVAIDQAQYTFEVRWNDRDKSWYFNMLEADGTPIIHGVRIVLGMYLGRRSLHDFFQHNVLIAIDTSNQGREAGLDDLGTRVQVVRFTDEEVLVGRFGVPR